MPLYADCVESCTDDGRCGGRKPSPNDAAAAAAGCFWVVECVFARESKNENPDDDDCVDCCWAGLGAYKVSNSRRMSKDMLGGRPNDRGVVLYRGRQGTLTRRGCSMLIED